MPSISVLMKPASGMCNMSCDYCFYCDETKKRVHESYGFMSESTMKNIIRRTILYAEGEANYAFQGGEPTLRGLQFFEKIVAFQKQYNKNGIRVSNVLQTNGYAIDEKWCQFFKENHFLIGVSVDGTEEIHNTYRHSRCGKPTYHRVMNAIGLLEKYGVDYNILTVVNKKTAFNIAQIYGLYRQKGWKYQQYIACLDPLGEAHGKNEYALEPEQYGRFLVELFELWYEDFKQKKQPYIRQFENYFGILLGHYPESCEQRGICGIQNVVEADGSVFPCDFYMLDEYCLGNLNTNQMKEITIKRKEISFCERSMMLDEMCNKCQYYRLCRGGCQRYRDYDEGSGRYQNYFCLSYQIFFHECIGKIYEVTNTIQSKGNQETKPPGG